MLLAPGSTYDERLTQSVSIYHVIIGGFFPDDLKRAEVIPTFKG